MQPVTPEEGSSPPPPLGIAAEMSLMLRRGREVWRLVPRRHKWALAGAAVVMACTSVCSTALALLLGQLVDGVQRGTLEGQTRRDALPPGGLVSGTDCCRLPGARNPQCAAPLPGDEHLHARQQGHEPRAHVAHDE